MEQLPLRLTNQQVRDANQLNGAPDDPEASQRPLLSIILGPSDRENRPAEVLGNLLEWLSTTDLDYELVIAIDGGRADLLSSVQNQVAGRSDVKIVTLNTRQGQLATIRAGIAVSSGRYIVTFPAYPQVECSAIPAILESLQAGADYAIGYRVNRKDSIFNRIASRIYNHFIHKATGVRFRDIACGLHGLRREIVPSIPSYGDNQVFMPILAAREGFKLVEVPVPHNPTEPKLRLLSPATYVRRALSLVSLAFLIRFTEKPLRPFGAIGGLLLLAGLVLGGILTWQRLAGSEPLADRPMLLLALLLITAGIQVIIVGLIGELLVYLHFRDQTRYRVIERIGSTRKEDRQ